MNLAEPHKGQLLCGTAHYGRRMEKETLSTHD